MNESNFIVVRNCDDRFRIRKVVVELYSSSGLLIDRRRMFAGPFFYVRLLKKMKKMKHFASMVAYASKAWHKPLQAASQKVIKQQRSDRLLKFVYGLVVDIKAVLELQAVKQLMDKRQQRVFSALTQLDGYNLVISVTQAKRAYIVNFAHEFQAVNGFSYRYLFWILRFFGRPNHAVIVSSLPYQITFVSRVLFVARNIQRLQPIHLVRESSLIRWRANLILA